MNMMQFLGHICVLSYGRFVPCHWGHHRVVSWGIRKFGLRYPRQIEANIDNNMFSLQIADYIPVHLYYSGYHEYAETAFFKANLRGGDVFFDLGANIGYFSLLAARKVGPTGEVHAFEISKEDFQKLEVNLGLNSDLKNVCLNRLAITDHCGCVGITKTQSAGMTSISCDQSSTSDTIQGVSLDSYVNEQGLSRIDFLKCDIEGAELLFLRGASNVLAKLRPIMVIEINPKALETHGASTKEIKSLLNDNRYVIYSFSRKFCRLALRQTSLEGIADYVNIIAIPREKSLERETIPLQLPKLV